MTTTTRQSKTPRQRAQEALGIATRLVSRLEKKGETLRIELAGVARELRDAETRRLYLAKHPDLGDPAQTSTPVDGAGGEES